MHGIGGDDGEKDDRLQRHQPARSSPRGEPVEFGRGDEEEEVRFDRRSETAADRRQDGNERRNPAIVPANPSDNKEREKEK